MQNATLFLPAAIVQTTRIEIQPFLKGIVYIGSDSHAIFTALDLTKPAEFSFETRILEITGPATARYPMILRVATNELNVVAAFIEYVAPGKHTLPERISGADGQLCAPGIPQIAPNPQGISAGAFLVIEIGKGIGIKYIVGIPYGADPPIDALTPQANLPGFVRVFGKKAVHYRMPHHLTVIQPEHIEVDPVVAASRNLLAVEWVRLYYIAVKQAGSDATLHAPVLAFTPLEIKTLMKKLVQQQSVCSSKSGWRRKRSIEEIEVLQLLHIPTQVPASRIIFLAV